MTTTAASSSSGEQSRTLPPCPCQDSSVAHMETIREHLSDCEGFLPLGCGCFIRVDPKALKTLDTGTLLQAACQSAGTCPHHKLH